MSRRYISLDMSDRKTGVSAVILKQSRIGAVARGAFTLVELLVVIAIIGTLVGLLLPAVQEAREASRRSACQNKLRQLGLGLANHESAKGHFPNGVDAYQWISANENASLLVKILPYIELESLYTGWDLTRSFGVSPNLTISRTEVPLFFCPSYADAKADGFSLSRVGGSGSASLPTTCYVGVFGWANATWAPGFTRSSLGARRGVFYVASETKRKDVLDGSSHTFMLGEWRPNFAKVHGYNTTLGVDSRHSPWAGGLHHEQVGVLKGMTFGPNQDFASTMDRRQDTWRWPFSSLHPGGANMVKADGATTFVKDTIDLTVWRNLGTIAGGEVDTQF